MDLSHPQISEIIRLAIQEDVGNGDITTDAIISKKSIASAKLIAKQEGVVAGLDIVNKVFQNFDNNIAMKNFFTDGDKVKPGDTISTISGNYAALLKGERTALNFLQRMSGIATKTNLFINELEGTKTKVLDTRKTLPGHRLLDKYAVNIGGGTNHRIGLFDLVMLKDNHIKAAGGIKNALQQVRDKWEYKFGVEVEAANLNEVKEAVEAEADIIMLDNMDLQTMNEAVNLINKKCKTEVSGNVTLERLKEIAELGVDFISVGELTHSVSALDISMKFE